MSGVADPSPRPTFSHRVEYALFRLMESVLSRMPLEVVEAKGRALGALVWALFPKHRLLVSRNLRIATGGWASPAPDIPRLVFQTFVRAGANMLSGLATGLTAPDDLRKHVRFTGMEHLLAPLGRKQGVIVVLPHMGNWEMLAQLIRLIGEEIKGGPMYRPLGNPLLNALIVKRRSQEGALLFSKRDGFFAPASLLKEGGALPILSDQRAGGHGEICPFFGKLSSCSPLPNLLARRTKAAITTLSIYSSGLGQWTFAFRPVAPGSSSAVIMQQLEHAMMDHLPDVFWFHDRWKVDRNRPLSFYTAYPREAEQGATVPARYLVEAPQGQETALVEALFSVRSDLHLDVILPESSSWRPDRTGITVHHRDPNLPPRPFLDQIDRSHRVPLDGALIFGPSSDLAGPCRKLGLRAIIGCHGAKKPWTRHFPCPATAADWQELAEELSRVPTPGK